MSFFTSKLLCTPLRTIEHAVVCVENGSVTALGTRESVGAAPNQKIKDFGDCTIVPGFFDIHVHGGANCDVMGGSPADLKRFEQFLAQHGVTSYYPTTVTASFDVTLSALERLADAIETKDAGQGRARALGIHLEGPFLSHKRRGMHPPEDLLPPRVSTFEKFWQASRGHVRHMTIAPELEGAEELIAEATKRGVCISIGHSDAELDEARRGVKAGARHATHTFNAMRPLDHRDPGILGEVLTNDQLTAEVIADGIHVEAEVVDLVFRAKGADNMVLVTDAISATGMPEGKYLLGTVEVEVKDGRCMRDGKLAGSVLTMDMAVRNLMKFASLDLETAVRCATRNPARTARLPKKGVIEPGADADFVVLSPAGEVRATVVGGVVVEESKESYAR
jgi:N-acetylglucosamine-6-phosphate deacetylase